MGVIVISPNNSFTRKIEESLRTIVHPLASHSNFREARLHLSSGFFRWCIVDADQGLHQAVKELQKLSDKAETSRWIAIAESPAPSDIEYARENGFSFILPKPLQTNLLQPLLEPKEPRIRPPERPPSLDEKPPRNDLPNLDEVRSFSRIFSRSKNLSEVVNDFILKVREIAGVNRIAIFLEKVPATGSSHANRFQHFCSIGIPPEIRDILELSRTDGIGGWVARNGQILQANAVPDNLPSEELLRTEREFKILGCEIAIPITDRERTIGVAILGGHLTRSAFSNDELQLFFHLMEELGLSIKNIRLHEKLAASHRLLDDVLTSMKTGSLVVNPDLDIPYANRAIREILLNKGTEKSVLVFADLPPVIAEKVHALTERGIQSDPFTYKCPRKTGESYHVKVIPFPEPSEKLPQSAMLLMEKLPEND